MHSQKTVSLSGVKWYLECNPDEYGYRSTTKYISFYFHIDSEKNVEAKLYFQCSNEEEDCRYNSCSTGHKKVELRQIPHDEFFNPLKYFISGGKVLVGVYGSFSYTEKQTNCYSMICNPKELNEKLLEKLHSDFDIFVGNEIIKVSKLLLSTESDVFERMFEANFTEARENRVEIHGYIFDTVKNAIDYCYGKNICEFLTDEENAIELLLFTNQYNFITLKVRKIVNIILN
uniref:BTB domain-containing protein n=1 Tax=Panagrolaimus sp. PS1159 TaxID=55785 RepID=A0AC35FU61_9BILA